MADNVIEIIISGKDDFSRTFGKFGSALGSMTKAATAAVAAATAVGTTLFAIAKTAANAQEKIQLLSEKTGIAVKTLSELEHAGVLANVSIESIAAGTRFLQRGMVEATRGTEEYAKEFRNLGIATTDGNGKIRDTGEVLNEVADKLSGLDAATRNAVGMKLMGRQFTELAPLLKDGSAGLRKAAEDARFLGVSMNEQATANADLFNDQLDRVGQAVKGVSIGIGNELIPMLTGLANATANWIAENRTAIVEWTKLVFDGLIRAYVTAKQIVMGVINFISKSFSSAANFDAFIENIKKAFRFLYDYAVQVVSHLIPAMIDLFKIAWQGFFELGKWAWMKVFDFVTGQDNAQTLGQVLFQGIPEATAASRAALEKDVSAMGQVVWEGAKTIVDAVGNTIGVTGETINAEMARIREQYTMTAEVAKEKEKEITQETLEQIRQRIEAQIVARTTELDSLIQFATSMEDIWTLTMSRIYTNAQTFGQAMSQVISTTFEQLTQGVGDAVANAIVRSENLGEALKSVMQNVAVSVISMLVKMGIQRMILSSIFGAAAAREAAAELTKGLTAVYVNSFASAASIPVIGWAIAPGVAATNLAIASAGAGISGGIGAAVGATMGIPTGVAHGGMENVPSESTFLLDKGERVLSPGQNRDLTDFLESGGSGGGVNVEQLNITIAVPDSAALIKMDRNDWREIVARNVIPAMDALEEMGVRQKSLERRRGF